MEDRGETGVQIRGGGQPVRAFDLGDIRGDALGVRQSVAQRLVGRFANGGFGPRVRHDRGDHSGETGLVEPPPDTAPQTLGHEEVLLGVDTAQEAAGIGGAQGALDLLEVAELLEQGDDATETAGQ